MVEIKHILSEPEWEKICSQYIFSPEFFKWVPDSERSFDWMMDIASLRKWITGRRVGWVAYGTDRRIGFIWGDIEEDTLTINMCFDEGAPGREKIEACKLAEAGARKLGVKEVFARVCIDNKRSLAFGKYLGYKRRRKVTEKLCGEDTEYYELSKVL